MNINRSFVSRMTSLCREESWIMRRVLICLLEPAKLHAYQMFINTSRSYYQHRLLITLHH